MLHALIGMIVSSCLVAAEGSSWAEETLEKMALDEKIGQLFMVAGYVDRDYAGREIGKPEIIEEMDFYIQEYHIGGIAYVGPSESGKQVLLTNHYQEISKYPILIAQDLEWGLSMRLTDAIRFPKNTTLGAIEGEDLIYEMGKEIAAQAKRIGVHMNLSPVLDVNVEPENITINVRSFGSSPDEVAAKGIAMIRGLQDGGLIASAKHFPGLGDIRIDPHLSLPCSAHGKKRLEEVELYPFARAIEAGVLSIQTEHLLIPTLESDPTTPSSLSASVVTDLLKGELGFQGLVLSGALRMKALTQFLSPEEIVVKAFLAGSDMLLMPEDLPKAYQALKTAVADEIITEQQIDTRVLKILQMKEKVGLDQQRTVSPPTYDELHSPFAKALKKELYKRATSLVRDREGLLPLSSLSKERIAYVQLGETRSSWSSLDSLEKEKLLSQIDEYDLVVLAVYPADPRRIAEIRLLSEKNQKQQLEDFRVHGISQSFLELIDTLKSYEKKVVVAFFGNPFGLHFFDDYGTVIMGYEDDPDAQEAVSQLLGL